MGWKGAEKLIRHWKILRGDNVVVSLPHPSSSCELLLLLSPLCNNISSSPCIVYCQVVIIRGKDKGETGPIKRVIRSQDRVIVEGKNLVICLLRDSCWPFGSNVEIHCTCLPLLV
jgi:hypothetical protein